MPDHKGHPHRRYNALTGDWVLVSPQRTQRPWQGQVEAGPADERPAFDPACYLCPGNHRAVGQANPDYTGTFVFDNDFPALLPDGPPAEVPSGALFQTAAASGRCRVVCFSPRHDLTLARMQPEAICAVIETWGQESGSLGETYAWVQVFENRGSVMGASNPHPHGQIWATGHLPLEAAKEDARQQAYFAAHGRPLLLDYGQAESRSGERVVFENDDWLAVVPFWAVWPFETLLLPKSPVRRLEDLGAVQRQTLAAALAALLVRYDNLFQTSFPYSMGWHPAPYLQPADPVHWLLHAHFYPPLLRSATVRKFMVGYEMLGEPQRDLTAEQAAERLRAQPGVHYLEHAA